jgi:hypothetical protein
MRRSFITVLLALAIAAPAHAADIGVGVFGGFSIPIVNDLSEQGPAFGVRVPVNLLPLLTVEPFFSSSNLGDVEETFAGTPYTRDGGKVTAFGANALFTAGAPMFKFTPFVGIGSYKLERDGSEDLTDLGIQFGLGIGISPIPKVTFSVRGEMAAIITDETSQKFANVTAGASYSLISVP